MIEWWNSLELIQHFFYAIGIVAMIVTVIQLLLTILGFGLDSVDLDFDPDIGDTDHSSGLGLFSVQTISAFFMAFGWSGVLAINAGLSVILAVIIACLTGVVAMLAMYMMMRALLKLQTKGNLEYDSVVGKTATVYVTIPGNNEDGGGQIQVIIQGRSRVATARKKSPGKVNPGQQVKITGMLTETSFLVEEV